MAEKIKDRRLFHLTEAKPYKQAFAAGQVVKVGESYTPFFGFYEGSRKYPMTLPDGEIVEVPAIKFLNQVKVGHLSCPNLPTIAAEIATHYVMLCRELIMEQVRKDEFDAEPPSRQRCLYACDTLDEAKYWKQFVGQNSSICELICSGIIHRGDASWLLGDSEPISVTTDRARRYWRGEAGATPQWETLFVGEATVIGFGL